MLKPGFLMSAERTLVGVLMLFAFNLPAVAQEARQNAAASGATTTESPKNAVTRTPSVSPVPADAPRFVSSGLEIKVASFGVGTKDRNSSIGITISLVLMNNNDYDVALLNVEGFSVIDNAGHSWHTGVINGAHGNVQGVMTCFAELDQCLNKDRYVTSNYVPHDRYTVVSARSAIVVTYFIADRFSDDDVGDLFTFSTKMMMYKVGTGNEIEQNAKVQKPRMITVGIPNILRR